jgi:uncharacterized integral membrane protein
MRIVAFILVVLLATGLVMGGIALLVLGQGDLDPVWSLVEILALTVFVYGPLTIGGFRATWDVEGSQESRVYYRRVVRVTLGLEALAAIGSVAAALVTSRGWVVPLSFIGTGVVLTAVALVVGPAAFRWDRAHPVPTRGWVAIEPKEIRRKVVTAVITFVGVMVIGVAGLSIVSLSAPHTLSVADVLLLSLSISFIAAGAVCSFSTWPWNRRLRDLTDRDPSRLRRIAKVVVRNKTLDLDERDRTAAARYAAVISMTLSFQLVYLVLLYAGIMLQQVNSLRERVGGPFQVVIVVSLVVGLVVLAPLQGIRIRRARRYVREHENDLAAPVAAAP